MSESAPLIRKQEIEKFDGSLWHQFQSPDSIIVLTSVGRRLLAGQRLAPILRKYKKDYRESASRVTDTRRFMVAGGNAHIFTLDGLPMVVKEAKAGADQLLPSLDRMDRLIDVIEKHCPHWIGVPRHYGLLIPKKTPDQQFLLMQKVNSGVTVGDILDSGKQGAPPERQALRDAAAHSFGNVTPEIKTEVANRFKELKVELRGALAKEKLTADEFLPDLDHSPYNVIVENADAPIAGSPYKYWVIDQ